MSEFTFIGGVTTGGGGSTAKNNGYIETIYIVKTAFTGASIGDVVTCTQIVDSTTLPPTTSAIIWQNQTTATTLSSAPDFADLALQGTSLPTNAATEATLSAINTRDSDIDYLGTVDTVTPFVLNVEEKGTVSFSTSGTWAGTVILEASLDGITWRPTTYVALSSGNSANNFSANTSGQINCVGLDFIRFRSNTITSGTVNVTAMSSRLVSNVMLDNSLPSGSNTIGKVQIADGQDVALGSTTDSPWSGTGNGTLIAIQKALWNKFLTDTNGNLKINQTATTFTYSPNNSTNGNSSVFVLANGGTWNGTIENAINQPYLIFGVVSNQNVTVTVSQYLDAVGTISDVPNKTFTISAGVPFSTSLAVLGNYIKLSVTNASGSSANLYVDSYYGLLPVQADSLTQAGNFKTAIQEAIPTGANVIGKTSSDLTNYGTTNSVFVGGTSQVQVLPTVTSASAYAVGNVVGGVMTFANAVNSSVLSGVLESISIAIKSLQTSSFKLYLFKANPTSSTFTDKSAPAIAVADAINLLDVYSFTTPDNGLGNNVTLYVSDAINRSFVASTSSLYAVLITLGTPTFSSTTDVVTTLSILRD